MKKRSKFIFLATLSTACLLSLASCQGAQGPKGDQGEPGINGTNGTNGKDGEPGKDGSSVLSGKGVPGSTLGKDGDSYIDTETFDFYVKSNGAWSKEGNIKGVTGDQGSTGSEGTKGEDGTSIRTGKGEPADTLGNDGDSYINLSNFDFYVKEDGKWSKEGNIKGEKGDQGDKGDKGNPGSNGSNGSNGKDGATAWGNTILPSENGYVTVSKGSYVKGEDVTFEFHPDKKFELSALKINNKDEDETGSSYLDKVNNNLLTMKMVENGFVVQAKFTLEDQYTDAVQDGQNNNYESVNDAINQGASSITLQKNTTLTDDITIASGSSVEIDLNNCNLNANGKTIYVSGNLTLKNSTGSGTYTGNIKVLDGGKLGPAARKNDNLFNGTSILSKNGLRTYDDQVENASLIIDSGVNLVSETKEPAISVASSSAKVEVKSGATVANHTSDSDAKAIEVTAGSVTVSGTVSASSGVAVDVKPTSSEVETKVTVAKDAVVSTESGTAITVSGGTIDVKGTVSSDAESKPAIEVKDGSVSVSGTVKADNGTAIKVSKDDSTLADAKATVTVSKGAEVTGNKAVEMETGEIKVEGGKVEGSTNAVEVKGGSVTVSSGTIKSTSEKEGAAIKVVQQETGTKTEINVTGGTIESNGGSAVSVEKEDGKESVGQEVNVKIDGAEVSTNGGEIITKGEGASTTTAETTNIKSILRGVVVYEEYEYNYGTLDIKDSSGKDITLTDNKSTITKGEKVKITLTPSEDCFVVYLELNGKHLDEKDMKEVDGQSGAWTYEVEVPAGGLTVEAKFLPEKIINSVQVNTSEGTKTFDVIEAALEKGYRDIILNSDSIIESPIWIGDKKEETLNINLNGHKIETLDVGGFLVCSGSTLNVTNGEAEDEGAIINERNDAPIIAFNTDCTKKININVGSNILLKGWRGVEIYYGDRELIKADINLECAIEAVGVENRRGIGVFVTHGFANEDNELNIKLKNVKIKSDGIGLYLGGYAKTIIEGENTDIQGAFSSIEVFKGELVINEGNFKSNYNGDFDMGNDELSNNITKGAGLVVLPDWYRKNLDVVINGGTFNGVYGLFADDCQAALEGDEKLENANIELAGGTFKGSKEDIAIYDLNYTVGKNVNAKTGVFATVRTLEELKEALASETVERIFIAADIDVNEELEVKGYWRKEINSLNLSEKENETKFATLTVHNTIKIENSTTIFNDVIFVNKVEGDSKEERATISVENSAGEINFNECKIITEENDLDRVGVIVKSGSERNPKIGFYDESYINIGYPVVSYSRGNFEFNHTTIYCFVEVYLKEGSDYSQVNNWATIFNFIYDNEDIDRLGLLVCENTKKIYAQLQYSRINFNYEDESKEVYLLHSIDSEGNVTAQDIFLEIGGTFIVNGNIKSDNVNQGENYSVTRFIEGYYTFDPSKYADCFDSNEFDVIEVTKESNEQWYDWGYRYQVVKKANTGD